VIEPVHDEFNEFLAEHGVDPYPVGQFMEPSPFLNLLLYPEPLQWDRWIPLDPDRFQYLEGASARKKRLRCRTSARSRTMHHFYT